MATFYFNGADDIANSVDPPLWSNLGNWWMNSGFTVPATALPTSSDSVVASVRIDTDGPRTVVNATVNGNGIAMSGELTVTGLCTFNDGANNYGAITGACAFNGTLSGNEFGGTITGNCTFTTSSYNYGAITTGNCTFSGGSWNGDSGNITGNCIFNDYSYQHGTITGDCTFNDNSLHQYGTITGYCTFNHSSYNLSTVTFNCTFNHSSYNNGIIDDDVLFNDSSYNNGTVNGGQYYQNRTPYPIPRGINGSSILGVI
jgi:hypothetical protein